VALLQLAAGADQDHNLARGEAACREALAYRNGASAYARGPLWQLGYLFDRPDGEPAGDLWLAPGRWEGRADPRTPAVREAVAA
jgi:hypothetical protein